MPAKPVYVAQLQRRCSSTLATVVVFSTPLRPRYNHHHYPNLECEVVASYGSRMHRGATCDGCRPEPRRDASCQELGDIRGSRTRPRARPFFTV